MMSLVADYDSSGTDTEAEGATNETIISVSDDVKDDNISANYFTTACNECDSNEDTDNEDKSDADKKQLTAFSAVAKRLPNPLTGNANADDDDCQSSVFINYYHRAEQAKLAVLEQHVKLSESQNKSDIECQQQKNQKKQRLCQNFQRGCCRFGSKCRFVHCIEPQSTDSDNHTDHDASSINPPTQTSGAFNQVAFVDHQHYDDFNDFDDSDGSGNRKRKLHSGVNDTLVPPKRAMRSLEMQRKQERPWTVRPK